MEESPMKCVKNVLTRKIDRIDDKQAAKLVASGKYVYVAKNLWKKAGRG